MTNITKITRIITPEGDLFANESLHVSQTPEGTCYDLIETDSIDRGLYRLIEKRYVIDAPNEGIDSLLFKRSIGIKLNGSDPVFFQPDMMTLKKIGDKFYPVVIKETYIKVEDKETGDE
jgi:hypothetical protein